MKPSDYKHIAAWCRVYGMSDDLRRKVQRIAAREGAPIDAVYRVSIPAQVAEPLWATIADVGVQTRMSIERQLNHGSRK